MTTETVDLAAFFDQPNLDSAAIDHYADAAHVSFQQRERFETLVTEYGVRVEQQQGDPLRLALGLVILGKFGRALEVFATTPASRERDFYAAHACTAVGRWDAAIEHFRQAARQGHEALAIDLQIAEVLVQAGRLDEAAKLIEKHAHAGQDRADWYVASGFLAEARGEREAALGAYERGLTLAPDDPAVFFRAARVYDLCGEDAKALQLYDRLTRRPRTHINALLNAAVIYEDLGRYEEAVHCLRRVIRAYPNHTRARLYLKDVESCIEMVIDDAVERRDDVRTRLLDTPLSEFELSVRARNCLKKMNIRTVAELVQHSEAELLAYKNFGETSLTEIKALLTKKGLRLGQQPDEVISPDLVPEPEPEPVVPLPPGQAAVLQKPVSELELSVRARRCLQRLNIQTLGDLVTFSEQELLATRNFGVTSLNEIRARIADFGLDLATKRPE